MNTAGCFAPCANVLCAQYGCQKMRAGNTQSRCPACGLASWQTCSNANCVRGQHFYTHPNPNYAEIFTQFQKQYGCICPPGANKDCESPACPRKSLPASALNEVKK